MMHDLIVVDEGRWGFGLAFRTKCSCLRWESAIHDNRPDAIRAHSLHALMAARGVIFA